MCTAKLLTPSGLKVSISVALFLVLASTMRAQDGGPKVGGSSTFDTSPGISGNDGASGRRRLTTPVVIPEDFSSLKLSAGFLLSMDVYDAPELSSDLRVDTNGDVVVPMVGRVHVAGDTVTQAATQIAQRLRDGKILNQPQVSLNITQYAGLNVTVLGEVHSPGRVELLAPHNLSDVIALAGGETQFAGKTIDIRHQTGITPQRQVIHYSRNKDDQILADTAVLPGDTITVERAGIVYVLGGVGRPGGYLMQEDGDLNVTQALSLAYGTRMDAAVGSVRLIRKMPDGKVQEIPIPYRDIEKGKVAPLQLQAEDVLYVPISKVKTILSTSLLATAASAAIYIR